MSCDSCGVCVRACGRVNEICVRLPPTPPAEHVCGEIGPHSCRASERERRGNQVGDAADRQLRAAMQWQVQDDGKATDHQKIEDLLQSELADMKAGRSTLDMAALQKKGLEAVRNQADTAARLLKAEESNLVAKENTHHNRQQQLWI